jgi:hypothetical protein
MDLSIPLVAILGVIGYNMNSNTNNREYIEKRKKVSENEKPSGKNIYASDDYRKIHQDELKRSQKINNYTTASNTTVKKPKRVMFTDNVQRVPQQSGAAINPDGTRASRSDLQIFDGPMFNLEKFNDPTFSHTEYLDNVGLRSSENFSSLSGLKTDFSHENMMPFFGAKIKGGGAPADIVSRYNGMDKMSKQVLEAEQNGKQNTYGSSAFTTLVNQDRFNTSMYEANSLPFTQNRVAPIPPEYVRPEHKTVDELRVLANPKTEDMGRIVYGMAIGKPGEIGENRKVMPRVWDHPETFATGDNHTNKPALVRNHKSTLRQTPKSDTTEIAHNLMPSFDKSRGNYTGYVNREDGSGTYNRDPHRESYANDWVRGGKKHIAERRDDETKNIYLRRQERESFGSLGVGIASDRSKGMRINTTDKPRITNKQLNTYEYKGSAISQGIHVPESRDNYYTTELRDKALRANYTPGGVAFGAPGIGSDDVNISWKERATVKDHRNAPKSNINTTRAKDAIGVNTKKDWYPQEHDFSDRY